MAVSTDPDLVTVLTWFEGAIDGRALLVNLKALRRDPNWRVQSLVGNSAWSVDLIHWPSRVTYRMRLEPVAGTTGAVWRQAA